MMSGNRLRQASPQRVEPHPTTTARVIERLDNAAALQLLSEAPYGRLGFVRDGEAEIRSLHHLVDEGEVIVRTGLGAALTQAVEQADGLAATYEADLLDVEGRQARCKQLLKTILTGPDDTIIAIRPKTVAGMRIVPAPAGIPGSNDTAHP